MPENVAGEMDRDSLIEAIKRQLIVRGDDELARRLYDELQIMDLEPETMIIEQGADDHDLFLILAGEVSVRVASQVVAILKAGDHVGEMAVIDTSAKRSASVYTVGRTVAGKISEPVFSRLADDYPRLWRHLAVQLADRLRQRNEIIARSSS